jgi:hypothetical protein
MTSRQRHQRQLCKPPALRAYDARVLQDDPVAFWTLEGGSAGLADRTGNGHHARSFNDHGVTGFLQTQLATMFDGVSQYVEVPDHDDLSVPTTGVITVEAWMRPDVLNFPKQESTGYVHWMGKGSAGQFEYVSRMYSKVTTDNRPNRISGYSFNLSGGLGTGSYFQDSVVAGEWIHYVLVINMVNVSPSYTAGYTKVFKNGVKRDQDRLTDYNIVPGNGTSPFRIGTMDFRSFFKGAIGRVAIYNYELSPLQVLDHYRTFVSAVRGTADFVQNVGSVVSEASDLHVGVTVPDGGIPAGHFLLISVMQDYTGGAPSVADNRGNTYTVDRSSSDAGLTTRATLLSAPVHGALVAGDVIYVTFPTAVANKVVTIDEFSGISFSAPLDRSNGRQGASSSPVANLAMTSQADELLFGFVGVSGPLSDSYTEDRGAEWTTLQRKGTEANGANVTLNSAWKSVNATSLFAYSPTLGVSRDWLAIAASYKAGAASVVPPPLPSIIHVKHVGSATSVEASVGLVVHPPSSGVQAGNTLVVAVVHDYTSGTPVVKDSAGNTYSVVDTVSDGANTVRSTVFIASVHAALSSSDVIVLQFPSVVVTKTMSVNEFSGVAFVSPVDQTNHTSANSTSPGVTTPVTPVDSDVVLVSSLAVAGGLSEPFGEDAVGFWRSLPRVGTASPDPLDDLTVNQAYRPVAASGTYRYMPSMGVSRTWLLVNSALRAGAAGVIPLPVPTATFVKNAGSTVVSATTTRASVTIPAGGVAAGHTLLVSVVSQHTAAAPTMADARGNVYTCDQSSPDASSAMRLSLFSVPVHRALPAGDRITVFFPVAVTSAVIAASEFSGLVLSASLDEKNNSSGQSALPGVTTAITTTHADDLVFGVVAVNGDLGESVIPDEVGMWNGLARVGTAGAPLELTANAGYRAVAAIDTFRFRPVLGTAQKWITVLSSYRAGVPVVVPPAIGAAEFVKTVGAASTKTTGTALTVTVPPGGVDAGNTLFVRVVADFTAGGGTVTDSRGNSYVRDRTSANGGNVMRASVFRCAVSTALQPGDVITLTLTAVAVRVMVVDEFAGVLTPTVIDQQNGATNTNTVPNVAVTTTYANDLVLGMCAVQGPSNDLFDNDPLWLPLDRVGTGGGVDSANRTIGGAYRSVAVTGLNRYQPFLGTSAAWIAFVIAYRNA